MRCSRLQLSSFDSGYTAPPPGVARLCRSHLVDYAKNVMALKETMRPMTDR